MPLMAHFLGLTRHLLASSKSREACLEVGRQIHCQAQPLGRQIPSV